MKPERQTQREKAKKIHREREKKHANTSCARVLGTHTEREKKNPKTQNREREDAFPKTPHSFLLFFIFFFFFFIFFFVVVFSVVLLFLFPKVFEIILLTNRFSQKNKEERRNKKKVREKKKIGILCIRTRKAGLLFSLISARERPFSRAL